MNVRPQIILVALFSLVFVIQDHAYENCPENAVKVRYKDRKFMPRRIELRAGAPAVLTVVNAGTERIEFESFKLRREKVVEPGETVAIHLPALRPGSYDFFDDFHGDVPEGEIVVR